MGRGISLLSTLGFGHTYLTSQASGTAGPGPLRYRDFRFLAAGSALAMAATVGESLVLGWLVLTRTDSPLMVGVALGVHTLPKAILGIPWGSAADAFDRRRLTRLLNLALALPMAGMGLLIATDSLELWHILVLAFLIGGLQSFDHTVRVSFALDSVGPGVAVRGLAALSLAGRAGAFVGSLVVGGITARAGLHVAYFVIAGTNLATALLMLTLRSAGQSAPTRRPTVPTAVRELLTEARRNRLFLAIMASVALIEVLGFSHMVLLPSIARDVLKVGVDGLGVMNAVASLGGIVGTLFLTTWGVGRRGGQFYLGGTLVFGLAIALLGHVPLFLLVLAVLALINSMISVVDIMSQTLMQQAVPNELRGRAMGAWMVAIGANPLGALQIGALASVAGLTFALTFNGLALAALAIFLAAFVPRFRSL